MQIEFRMSPNHGYKLLVLAISGFMALPSLQLLPEFPAQFDGPKLALFLFSAAFCYLFCYCFLSFLRGLTRKRFMFLRAGDGDLSWRIEDRLFTGAARVQESVAIPFADILDAKFLIHTYSGTYNYFSMSLKTPNGAYELGDSPLTFALQSQEEAERLLDFYRLHIEPRIGPCPAMPG